jgi:chromosome segregation ATPase
MFMSGKEPESGSWEEYSKLVLRSLSKLEERMDAIEERLAAVEGRLATIDARLEHSLQDRAQLHRDVDALKMFRVQAMAVFGAVQFVVGLLIAFKDKLFGK